MAELEDRVRESYLRHFQETKNSAEAWNRTLVEIAGPFDPDASEDAVAFRDRVGKILRETSFELDAEAGDPYALAMKAALEDLKRNRVAEQARQEYLANEEEAKARIRKAKKLDVPKGPKEWSPKKEVREEEMERILEREKERNPEDLTLYILFDEKGGLESWTLDYPSYFQGHGGPLAAIPVSEGIDYDDIRHGIDEAFQSIDWDEIELEDDDET